MKLVKLSQAVMIGLFALLCWHQSSAVASSSILASEVNIGNLLRAKSQVIVFASMYEVKHGQDSYQSMTDLIGDASAEWAEGADLYRTEQGDYLVFKREVMADTTLSEDEMDAQIAFQAYGALCEAVNRDYEGLNCAPAKGVFTPDLVPSSKGVTVGDSIYVWSRLP